MKVDGIEDGSVGRSTSRSVSQSVGRSVRWLVGWVVGWFVDIFVCLFVRPYVIHLTSLTFRCLWFGPIPVTPEHVRALQVQCAALPLLAQDLNGKNKQAHKENIRYQII